MLPWVHGMGEAHAARGLRVIAVHGFDAEDRNEPDAIREAVRKLGVVDPVYLDAGFAASRAFGARLYPTLVLVDRRGMVRYRHRGTLGWRSERRLAGQIDLLLSEQ